VLRLLQGHLLVSVLLGEGLSYDLNRHLLLDRLLGLFPGLQDLRNLSLRQQRLLRQLVLVELRLAEESVPLVLLTFHDALSLRVRRWLHYVV